MSDHRPETFDQELSLKGILGFLLVLTAITVAVLILFVGVSRWLRDDLASRDAPPSPLAEANVVELPPEPVLQAHPVADLVELRAQATTTLTSFDWVDREAGIVRTPIEDAMRRVAEQGVPRWTAGSEAP